MEEGKMQYAGLGNAAQSVEKETLGAIHKRLQEQLNYIIDMEGQVRNLADSTFGPQPINDPQKVVGDAIDPTLATLTYSIERATSRLRTQINRF